MELDVKMNVTVELIQNSEQVGL